MAITSRVKFAMHSILRVEDRNTNTCKSLTGSRGPPPAVRQLRSSLGPPRLHGTVQAHRTLLLQESTSSRITRAKDNCVAAGKTQAWHVDTRPYSSSDAALRKPARATPCHGRPASARVRTRRYGPAATGHRRARPPGQLPTAERWCPEPIARRAEIRQRRAALRPGVRSISPRGGFELWVWAVAAARV